MTRKHDLPTNNRRTTTWVALHLLYGALLLGSFAGASSLLQLAKREEHPQDTFAADKAGPNLSSHNNFPSFLNSTSDSCRIDRSQPPVLDQLIGCKNSSLFHLWRTKARVTGPRGWMNDPMAIFETKSGAYHVGYQCNPDHLVWANISQCSAFTTDFVHFKDHHSWKDPRTIVPTQLYDIRGVFDGTVIKDGWNGHPSIIYTSVFTGPIGARSNPPELEGVETQSVAYTEDDGHTWTKLNFGANGNPVIYKWPENHLSGFRDPFVFKSSEFSRFYANESIVHQLPGNPNALKPSGHNYLLLSGGIRTEVDPIHGGPRLFLYRQTEENNIRDWTYLGPLVSSIAERNQTSEWTGAKGINYECGAVTKLDEHGLVKQEDDSADSKTQLNIIATGSEGGRTGPGYWPIWHAVSWDFDADDGNVRSKIDFSGVIDWGKAYAFHLFESKNRQLLVGWTYEDDEKNILTPQRGAQGAFTLFRELFVQVLRNIHPAALKSPEHAPSWTTRTEADGSHSLMTVGQRILPEISSAFRKHSKVSALPPQTLSPGYNPGAHQHSLSTNAVRLEKQPKDRYYAISARLEFYADRRELDGEDVGRAKMSRGGFRILSSQNEWTDVYYDPSTEYLVVDRSRSSAIPSFGNSSERAKLRLWPIVNPVTKRVEIEPLNLTIIVDNSVVEVHANERAIITTRVYPWYEDSIGIDYLVEGRPTVVDELHLARHSALSENQNRLGSHAFQPHSVHFTNVEIWDGLVNAWPDRPRDTRLPGVYSHNITSSLYGLWPDL
ncbi:hypothetical protein PGT21_031694 [Puccinia graminis f. sp. tritici]|uniref:Uncharacterized protein n=2 Tax=Puccinia graminis f. sp. tritici TaxID=56615 RepID=E3K303_PUCGT|nr:uncharacterized protein PGTG_04816 [Puccinia graminis f. sp. tritici CRL 75-36-700-3]EFP78860.2 hypothetical protein PGTG_04816 [Puccinia graminis f. sp. tritici CRL 75-36-700-3]KAA1069694.1 hypothetical protein PGT21_031694 [Puccinia graminis f. sp. tritici]